MKSYLTIKQSDNLKNQIIKILDFYKQLNFDLVPIAKNSKIPIEKDWTNKEHKDIEIWKKWLFELDLNIGVKTGKISNITIIDIDTKPIPKEIEKFIGKHMLIQETTNGYHLFYKYVSDLPKTHIDKLKIDIENDGGQVVLYPSIVDNKSRTFIQSYNIIPEIPTEFKKCLKEKITSMPTSLQESLSKKEFDIDFIKEGNRNSFLTKFGGILRKELNITQTTSVLNMINRYFCRPSLAFKELNTIIKSLDKYVKFDEHDLALKIINYLKIVHEATGRDVKEVVEEKKELVDKALASLVKEGYIIKRKRTYHIIKKAEWKDILTDRLDNEIPLKIPYFHDIALFQWGDMILLGSKSKWGKTTIGINIIKEFVHQGQKPYYICLETGSRFIKTAIQLGLKDGDFYWDFQADPTKIELEKNAITIIDWLLIEDKAMTDSVLKHFIEQLFKTGGLLIIFMQLKENRTWFAPNMVKQFPALAGRYIYDDEEDGTFGRWEIDVIREAKFKIKRGKIPCKYNWDTKELVRIDELENRQTQI